MYDMKVQLMNIQRQHETHSKEYEDAAIAVLRSGQYIGGKEVELFEQEFAAYEGAKFGISCGNGTDAIVLALRALGIGPGDEVITVSWTFFATAESISAVGATPVFVDICADSYCINTDLVEAAITEKTKAILPVHFYGQSCDMDKIREICQRHDLYLVSDCAQAAGTKYKSSRKGILGDISCFSFFPTKNLGGVGDGGMVLTDNEEFARKCRALKSHGSGEDGLWALKSDYEKSGKDFPENMAVGTSKYYNYLIGYNSRLDALQAAILRKKLIYLDEFVNQRRDHAEKYNKSLSTYGYIIPKQMDYCDHSYYIYVVKHPDAQRIMCDLKENGIGCGTYYPVPLHLQGAFAHLGYKKGDLPVTEELSETTFAIPVFPEMTDEEQQYVINTLKEAANG